LKQNLKGPNFSNDIITGDESWVFQCDPETERQIFQWTTSWSPLLKTARTSC